MARLSGNPSEINLLHPLWCNAMIQTRINKYEYGFLKGDKKMWPEWGAAYAAVSEFCKNFGYGEFGEPTKLGKKVMEQYELRRATVDYSDV
jgi:hypothetical protein